MCADDFVVYVFFFFKQKTAYEMRISDWSSDVCSSDLCNPEVQHVKPVQDLTGQNISVHSPYQPTAGLRTPRAVGSGVSPLHSHWRFTMTKIGRASCRERVCQYG